MAKNKEGIVSVALRLFIICFVSALILAFVNMMTESKIAENNSRAFKESCEKVMGEAEFTDVDLSQYGENVEGALAKDADGNVIGICIKQSVKGYNSGLVFMTGIANDCETITGINIMEHSETPGLGAEADTDGFKNQFKNLKTPVMLASENGDGGVIQAITGATKTTNGIKNGVNNAAVIAKDYFEKEGIK